MNINRIDWFRKYVAFRSTHPFRSVLPSSGVRVLEAPVLHNEMEQAIYYFLQPTGLLYACPLNFPFPEIAYPQGKYFDGNARAQVIFIDSLFACLVADRHFMLAGMNDEADHFTPAIEMALEFFLDAPASVREITRRSGGARRLLEWPLLFGDRARRRSVGFEREVGRRLAYGRHLFSHPDVFYNSFLFLDLYFCLQWQRRRILEAVHDGEVLAELYAEQELQQTTLLQVIVAAIKSNGDAAPAELRLVRALLRASRLSPRAAAQMDEMISRGIKLDDIRFPDMPWIVRRYFLELVLITMMADGQFTDPERTFVENIVERLGLWREELEQSFTAVESFLVSAEQQLGFLRERPSLANLRDRLAERAAIALRKNLDRVVTEIKETQELSLLLVKATHEPLSPLEKAKVRAQLVDVIKTIPALAIFALPGGGIALPLLIKLLPFNLLPSSFED
ncbi:MAG: hypothetical protein HY423_02750 [Candidatus Lambdaproteobacteria bacterium]|nr:hypothetical protein [Candidatus Lambdaproteobacteria bacterium]